MAGTEGCGELYTGWSYVVHRPSDEPELSDLPSTVDMAAFSAELNSAPGDQAQAEESSDSDSDSDSDTNNSGTDESESSDQSDSSTSSSSDSSEATGAPPEFSVTSSQTDSLRLTISKACVSPTEKKPGDLKVGPHKGVQGGPRSSSESEDSASSKSDASKTGRRDVKECVRRQGRRPKALLEPGPPKRGLVRRDAPVGKGTVKKVKPKRNSKMASLPISRGSTYSTDSDDSDNEPNMSNYDVLQEINQEDLAAILPDQQEIIETYVFDKNSQASSNGLPANKTFNDSSIIEDASGSDMELHQQAVNALIQRTTSEESENESQDVPPSSLYSNSLLQEFEVQTQKLNTSVGGALTAAAPRASAPKAGTTLTAGGLTTSALRANIPTAGGLRAGSLTAGTLPAGGNFSNYLNTQNSSVENGNRESENDRIKRKRDQIKRKRGRPRKAEKSAAKSEFSGDCPFSGGSPNVSPDSGIQNSPDHVSSPDTTPVPVVYKHVETVTKRIGNQESLRRPENFEKHQKNLERRAENVEKRSKKRPDSLERHKENPQRDNLASKLKEQNKLSVTCNKFDRLVYGNTDRVLYPPRRKAGRPPLAPRKGPGRPPKHRIADDEKKNEVKCSQSSQNKKCLKGKTSACLKGKSGACSKAKTATSSEKSKTTITPSEKTGDFKRSANKKSQKIAVRTAKPELRYAKLMHSKRKHRKHKKCKFKILKPILTTPDPKITAEIEKLVADFIKSCKITPNSTKATPNSSKITPKEGVSEAKAAKKTSEVIKSTKKSSSKKRKTSEYADNRKKKKVAAGNAIGKDSNEQRLPLKKRHYHLNAESKHQCDGDAAAKSETIDDGNSMIDDDKIDKKLKENKLPIVEKGIPNLRTVVSNNNEYETHIEEAIEACITRYSKDGVKVKIEENASRIDDFEDSTGRIDEERREISVGAITTPKKRHLLEIANNLESLKLASRSTLSQDPDLSCSPQSKGIRSDKIQALGEGLRAAKLNLLDTLNSDELKRKKSNESLEDVVSEIKMKRLAPRIEAQMITRKKNRLEDLTSSLVTKIAAPIGEETRRKLREVGSSRVSVIKYPVGKRARSSDSGKAVDHPTVKLADSVKLPVSTAKLAASTKLPASVKLPVSTAKLAASTRLPASAKLPAFTKLSASTRKLADSKEKLTDTELPASTTKLADSAKLAASIAELADSTKLIASTKLSACTRLSASTKLPASTRKLAASTEKLADMELPASTRSLANTKLLAPTTKQADSTKLSASGPKLSASTPKLVDSTKLAASTAKLANSTELSTSTKFSASMTEIADSAKPTVSTAKLGDSIKLTASTKLPASTKLTASTKLPASTKLTASTKLPASTRKLADSTEKLANTELLSSTRSPASTKLLASTTKQADSTKLLASAPKLVDFTKLPASAAKLTDSMELSASARLPTSTRSPASTELSASTAKLATSTAQLADSTKLPAASTKSPASSTGLDSVIEQKPTGIFTPTVDLEIHLPQDDPIKTEFLTEFKTEEESPLAEMKKESPKRKIRKRRAINRTGFPTVKKKKKKVVVETPVRSAAEIEKSKNREASCDRVPKLGEEYSTFLQRSQISSEKPEEDVFSHLSRPQSDRTEDDAVETIAKWDSISECDSLPQDERIEFDLEVRSTRKRDISPSSSVGTRSSGVSSKKRRETPDFATDDDVLLDGRRSGRKRALRELHRKAKDVRLREKMREVSPASSVEPGVEKRLREDRGGSGSGDEKKNKKAPRWRKKYLVAGLFSDYYKEDDETARQKRAEAATTKARLVYNPDDHPFGLLPAPYHCGKYLRCRKIPFQLPHDLWWQHTHSQLPGRDIVPSWNYRKIRTNVYNVKLSTGACEPQSCNCKDSSCGDDCINRLVLAECPTTHKCRNQRIQKHEWAPGLEKFMTDSKGWGVRTNLAIGSGEFILEYVGEVVSDQEFKERMASRYAHDTHHYCLHLDGGLVIDGHRMGGDGRFVNHSCSPNCEMQKWSVNGQFRMALFSLRGIEPGEELTYDYNFSLFNPADGQECKCGSADCRGVIGGKSQRVKREERVAGSSAAGSSSSSSSSTATGVGSGGGTVAGRVGRPRKNQASKKAVCPKENGAHAGPVPVVAVVASHHHGQAAQQHQVPVLKPLSNSQRAYVREHRVFLLRNLYKVRRNKTQPPISRAQTTTPTDQTTNATVNTTSATFLNHINALRQPRNIKTRRLAQAEDDPELQKTAKLATFLQDLYNIISKTKDERDEQLSAPFLNLPSKRKHPSYYAKIHDPVDLTTIEQNIASGVYKTAESFDLDMGRLFSNAIKFYGRTSEVGIAATRLRKIYIEAKRENVGRYFEEIGEKPPLNFLGGKDRGEEEDVIRCICGMYRDEGLMIQCERCLVWQHCECVRADEEAPSYHCERCVPRTVDFEIAMDEFTEHGHRYYMTLLRGDLQLRQGDTVYVLRDIPIPGTNKKHTYDTIGSIKYSDLDIFRIERLWKDSETGQRYAYGHHYLRPHETYHEPTRKFFPNEVMRVPLYEAVPVELIMEHCWVMDVNTYCKGRPMGAPPEHIYICDYRVDKTARLFSKVAKSKFPICTKSYAFERFETRLKISRTYTPHDLDSFPVKSRGRKPQDAADEERTQPQPQQMQPVVKTRAEQKMRLNGILLNLLGKLPTKQPLDVSYLLEGGRRRKKNT